MRGELKVIDRDSLKVGDVVGVARAVTCGWMALFRRKRIIPVEIVKITPKNGKIVSEQFGEHDKREIFYELNEDAALETIIADAFKVLDEGIYELGELRRNDGLIELSDEDILEASDHIKAIMEILEKYGK